MAEFDPQTLYVFINTHFRTAMDLSGANSESVIGFKYHGGANQKWRIEGSDGRYRIANASKPLLYLSLNNGSKAEPLICSEEGTTFLLQANAASTISQDRPAFLMILPAGEGPVASLTSETSYVALSRWATATKTQRAWEIYTAEEADTLLANA